MTTKRNYVRPAIVMYEVQPCTLLAESLTQGQTESLKKDDDFVWGDGNES